MSFIIDMSSCFIILFLLLLMTLVGGAKVLSKSAHKGQPHSCSHQTSLNRPLWQKYYHHLDGKAQSRHLVNFVKDRNKRHHSSLFYRLFKRKWQASRWLFWLSMACATILPARLSLFKIDFCIKHGCRSDGCQPISPCSELQLAIV